MSAGTFVVWGNLKPLDRVEATFRPKRTDNLRPEILPFIGRRGIWMVSWLMGESDQNPGQWALTPYPATDEFWQWVPQEDLVDVSVLLPPRAL